MDSRRLKKLFPQDLFVNSLDKKNLTFSDTVLSKGKVSDLLGIPETISYMAFKVPFGKKDHKIMVQPRLTELDRRREGPNDHGECKDLLKPEGELSVPSSYIFFSWDDIGHCLPYLVKFY